MDNDHRQRHVRIPRFNPDQRAIVHGLRVNAALNGTEVTIVRREHVEQEPSIELGTFTGWIYKIDPTMRWISEPFLRPIDPKGSWDDCVWRPREVACES